MSQRNSVMQPSTTALLICLSGLASAPALAGDEHAAPQMSPQASPADHAADVFGPDPGYEDKPYSIEAQLKIYGDKKPVHNPRPLLELGREIYGSGPLQPSGDAFGSKNPTDYALSVYGDWRTAIAWNDNGTAEEGLLATRLNLDVDLKLTGTERIHAFFRPLDEGGRFSRCEFSGDSPDTCKAELDVKADTIFFEGDLSAIMAGFSGEYQTFDLPFAVGKMPLLFQNGIWLEDIFTGVAATIPAINSAKAGISNMDITLFGAFDKVSTPAVRDLNGEIADHNVNIYGVTAFIEANQGYWETGFAHIDAEDELDDQSYNNFSVAFTKRYGGWLSNSVRVVHNFGQDRNAGSRQTADGTALLIENSLITSRPLTLVPYLNLFAGFDRPQSVARDAGAGGILKNTGINFETDGLTGFPTLDATANNTWGGALGIEYLFSLERQVVAEVATVQTMGGAAERAAAGDQYALGLRYQQNLDRAWLIRADAMIADRENAENLSGIRFEIRRKF